MLQKITQSWKGKYSLSSPSNQPSLTQGTVVFYGQKNRFWFWSSSPSPYWWTEILLSQYYMALPEINLSLNEQFFTIFVLVWAPHAFCILSESLFFCIYVDIGLGLLRENPSTAQCFFNSAHHCNKRPTKKKIWMKYWSQLQNNKRFLTSKEGSMSKSINTRVKQTSIDPNMLFGNSKTYSALTDGRSWGCW